MMIVDSHCHAGLNWFEPVELLVHQMDANGVDKGVLIQHRGNYDATYLFECARRFPGRFAVVVIVDVSRPDAPSALERWAEQGSGRGSTRASHALSRPRSPGHLEEGQRTGAGGELPGRR